MIQRAWKERRGFTLIELLVVIAIIAVLVSLTVAGVMKWLGKREDGRALKDLRELDKAATAFKSEFGFYPPSKIILKPSRSNYGATPLEILSLQVLDKMFGKSGTFNFVNVQWVAGLTAAGEVLEGDQCLVFFLGGPNQQGFAKLSDLNLNPAAPKSSIPQRFGPYYDNFEVSRLYVRPGKTFPSYMDAYSSPNSTTGAVPYVMFSSEMSGAKSYNSGHAIAAAPWAATGVGPYKEPISPPTKYWNPVSVQILCAGRDRVFGPGGAWSPATAGAMFGAGVDDMANFYDAELGVTQ